jgi:undecaprenyldiphospho-muramoylpentapeptide beta-N-acetylglucosaminyltransferase
MFVGSRRGIERRMVPAAGFELVALPGRGIARRLTLSNFRSVAGLLAGFLRAFSVLRRAHPAVVVVVGGYASVPAAAAAIILGVPVVVSEQNAVPGLANRLAGRFAAACAVSFPETPLPRAVLTGNPVRTEIADADRSEVGKAVARQELGIDVDALVIAAVGGSLGALRINEAVFALAGSWATRRGITIYHVVGERDWESFSASKSPSGGSGIDYRLVRFEERMDLVLRACDLVVSRAGATTVAEIAVVGVASILVPLNGSPGNHQGHNARVMADAGAAVMISDNELNALSLGEAVEGLIADRDLLAQMATAARALGRPDAADSVARLVEEHARD